MEDDLISDVDFSVDDTWRWRSTQNRKEDYHVETSRWCSTGVKLVARPTIPDTSSVPNNICRIGR
jgi:hypothetical protein